MRDLDADPSATAVGSERRSRAGARARTYRWRSLRRGFLTAAVAGLLLWSALLRGPSGVLAAGPSPTPAEAGDPRSSGEGAGLVGSPLLAVGGMLAVGLLAAGGTLIYIRLTGGSRRT